MGGYLKAPNVLDVRVYDQLRPKAACLPLDKADVARPTAVDPLRKFSINREQSAYMFSIVWLRLAAWDF